MIEFFTLTGIAAVASAVLMGVATYILSMSGLLRTRAAQEQRRHNKNLARGIPA